jgi:ABC-type branched-subunit amino acid transport system ATPase component
MLAVRNLQAAYGAAQVLFDISFEIGRGEVVTLLGRNGMGKTTTVRTIMGLLRPKSGEVRFGKSRLFRRSILCSLASASDAAISARSFPVASSRCSRSAAL